MLEAVKTVTLKILYLHCSMAKCRLRLGTIFHAGYSKKPQIFQLPTHASRAARSRIPEIPPGFPLKKAVDFLAAHSKKPQMFQLATLISRTGFYVIAAC